MRVTSFLVRARRGLALTGTIDLLLQKGEQIRQVGKASALASVWAFEGGPPDCFFIAHPPQAQ
jgi:hypothetical protein